MSSTETLRGRKKQGRPGGLGAKKRSGQTNSVSSSSSLTVAKGPPVGTRTAHCLDTVVPARAGDHHAIHRLLVSLLHQPSAAEFQAQLERPDYEPRDRLVVKRGEQVMAHAQLMKCAIHFGERILPIMVVNDFVSLPELRSEGLDGLLLEAIESRIADGDVEYGVLRTSHPEWFMERGWSICLRHSYSSANALEILSYLRESEPATRSLLGPDKSQLKIRIWRHVEQAALVRLYEEYANGAFGPAIRTDAYWHWLISRRGYDRIYVAIDGPDKMELSDSLTPIVGYAVVRESRILELVTASDRADAGNALLARACRDAIEQDRHYVQLHAAPHDPLHGVFTAAGGEQHYYEAESGEVSMVRFADPIRFLKSLGREFTRRSKRVGLPLPSELGLQLNGEKYGLAVGSRQTKLTAGRVGRSYIECDTSSLAQLVLGHTDVRGAVAAGRLQASTRVAVETASAIFPQLPIWRPPWDESPAV